MAGNDVIRNPGFNNSGVSPQQYLANVIQGEASTPAGQFAVASVIQNRTDVSYGGFGDTVLESASQGGGTLYPQFSGYQNAPVGGSAYNLAGQMLNGNLSDSGSTGNALYYNNASTGAYANNGNNVISGNYFSDQYGRPGTGTLPSDNFQPPVYGGSTPDTVANQNVSNNEALQSQGGLPSFAQGDGGAANPYYDGSSVGGGAANNYNQSAPYFTQLGTANDGTGNGADTGTEFATIDPNSLGGNNYGSTVAPDSTSTDTGPVLNVPVGQPGGGNVPNAGYGGNTFQGSVEYANPQTPDSGASGAVGAGSMTIPQAIDSQTTGAAQDTTAQDKAISSAADSTNKSNQANTKSLTGTLSGIASMFDAAGKNLFVRGFIIILGLVIVGFGLYTLAKNNDLVPKTVPIPV